MDSKLSKALGARPLLLDPTAASAPAPRPSAAELHGEARRRRSAAIGDLLLRLWALLRRAWIDA